MTLKFIWGPTLQELIEDNLQNCDPETVSNLLQTIENWLPYEQTYCGSQLPAFVEHEIDGYNLALQEIKSKLYKTG